MRIRMWAGAASALAVLLAGGTAVSAHADGQGASEAGRQGENRARVGLFETRGDYVHFSHTVQGRINAHGWWKNINTSASMAKVTIWLQVKSGSGWRTLDTGVKTVPSGGGSNKRAVANWGCTNFVAKHEFRSVVDVDLIGVPDDPKKLVTPAQTLYCGV